MLRRAADGIGVMGEDVEVGGISAALAGKLLAVQTQQLPHEQRRRDPGVAGPGCVTERGGPAGDHQVRPVDGLDGGVEGVEQLAIDDGALGYPAPVDPDPLGRQVVVEVGLAPGLVVADVRNYSVPRVELP